jgi:predicted nucleotidyltransferase
VRTIYEVLPPDAPARLGSYKLAVEHAVPGVEKVILFGLRARGQGRKGSDYDVAVVIRDLFDRRRVQPRP